ncbi:hypothetical protein EDD85DRAFT_962516 [Armillaria nabsnona]|nr:hypothetical protein EDD85DRAFT_962516 [Armillaria nabsnona]
MAQPTDPAELTKVQAQDAYNAAATTIDELLDIFPNPTWDSTRTDTWLIDVRDYDLDVVPLPVRRTQAKRSKATVSPSHLRQDAAATHSRMTTPAPLSSVSKPTTPMPATPKRVPLATLTKPPPAPQLQVTPKPMASTLVMPMTLAALPLVVKTTGASQPTTQGKVRPTPITTGSANIAFETKSSAPVPATGSNSGPAGLDAFFPPDPSSPLHQKPGNIFKVGPPVHAARSLSSVQTSSSWLLSVDAATRASVLPGPDPGTDDEEDLVGEERAEEVAGTDGEDDDVGRPDDEEDSPPPTKKARCLHPPPRILFVFDETTGDFVESYLTIFLPRPAASPVPNQDLCHSVCSRASPVNPDAVYLKTLLGPKSDATKKKKDSSRKEKVAGTAIPHKRARDDGNDASIVEKPATKKLKSKDAVVAGDKVVRATPAICKHGPGPSKPPAVTLGVGGGGFGEKVPSTVKAIKNGLKSIGVLEVEEDFGNFVKVDCRYWNKEVAPFVGERYTEPCDHCKRLGTQCHKFLTNTVICVCCHYSKLPCKVNGVPALNPINHYHPKSYHTLNTFEGALDTLAQHANSIEDIVINYMAGLNALAQLNSLRVQAGRLHECATFDESDADEDDDNEAPDDVAEGVAGPSKKRKGKSG